MSNRGHIVAPSISKDRIQRLGRRCWSEIEIRESLEMLDDIGMKLLGIFGDPRCAQRIDGQWLIVIAGLSVPAATVRMLYRSCASAVHGLGCPVAGLIADALLLAATTGPLTTQRLSAMAGKLAPATWDGLENAEQAVTRLVAEADLLQVRGLLSRVTDAAGNVTWTATLEGTSVTECAFAIWSCAAES